MAAIERGSGESDEVVRGWLAKALGASRGPQWVCTKCNHVNASWGPVCENCGAFDTLDWRTPSHAEDSRLADSAMLPLIIGAGPTPPPPEPEPHAGADARARARRRRRSASRSALPRGPRSRTPSSRAPPTRRASPAATEGGFLRLVGPPIG